ncbi:conserved hypothetical protein [Theileria orientalis strain Shintoku]|uniref:Large ribosomal subunit protein mL46 N-terminal domain-containing protein n=1 Tax=Theileria orientalis strain Shintoku TaxID=869250 RepID=J4C955_THEOR|nr:conserved hypothetical protein [Theileria orientalis strain Shintoku]BAM41948.1 conserved hypothetical protein [Theileria orientalis strain Shintoku]|eukprot:XP_009692249.1 conserved hypothetical protein [Theileria orientalis strain Shintoku]
MLTTNLHNVCRMNFIRRNYRWFSTLCEHCGWHLKVSLCLERQPLEYSENEVDRLFREFHESWTLKTNNGLKIPSLETIERKITHKLARSKETETKKTPVDSMDSESDVAEKDDLESLLSGELNINLLPRRSRRVLQKDAVSLAQPSSRSCVYILDHDLHNINRMPTRWLFLLLKYKNSQWSLPITDLYYGDSVRQTLARLCDEQICDSYRPYFIGYSPFTHQKLPFESTGLNNDLDSPIDGLKVFYYRARHIPSCNVNINSDVVDDYAWCTMDELESKLDKLKFNKVINTLPLFNLI